jgi:lambda repressor-like predicted transcriptional regulator
MTRPRLPIKSVLVSPGRRRRGAGEPAPLPVPPPVETKTATEMSSLETDGGGEAPTSEPAAKYQTPFRLGPGGLVVVIVPEQLKAACARRGWSLTHLARRAGISYPTMKSTLRGKAVRPRTAWKLARALGQEETAPVLDQLLEAP